MAYQEDSPCCPIHNNRRQTGSTIPPDVEELDRKPLFVADNLALVPHFVVPHLANIKEGLEREGMYLVRRQFPKVDSPQVSK